MSLYWNLLQPATNKVAECINAGIKVLIYNGYLIYLIEKICVGKMISLFQIQEL